MKNLAVKIGFVLILLTALCKIPATAQSGNPLQFLSEVSQSSQSNPAFHNKTEKLVIGLPVLSGAALHWNANFSADYFFTENFDYSFDNFYTSLGKPGDAVGYATLPLVYLSHRNDKRTLGFSLSERALGWGNFDHEFLKFIDQGLLPYYGQEEEFGPFSFKTQVFRELAFSYAKQVNRKLSVGIRPKVLFGRAFYDIQNLNVIVHTDEDRKVLQVIPEGSYRISGPIDVQYDPLKGKTSIKTDFTAGDYFFKFKNMGAGIDLGFTYQLNKETTVAAAITDIAFTTLNYKAYKNTFVGSIDYTHLYQSSDSAAAYYFEPRAALDALTDSLPYKTTSEAFAQRRYELLPVTLNLMVTHRLNDRMKLNFANNLTYYNGDANNYLAGYFNLLLGTRFELSSGLNLYNIKQVMPGFACSYTARGVQLYLATNNIARLVQPSKAKNLNLSFGVNLLFSTEPN